MPRHSLSQQQQEGACSAAARRCTACVCVITAPAAVLALRCGACAPVPVSPVPARVAVDKPPRLSLKQHNNIIIVAVARAAVRVAVAWQNQADAVPAFLIAFSCTSRV